MANNLGSLVVSLGLDAAEFIRGLSKSEYQAQQWARNFERGINLVRGSMLGLGAAAAGAFAFVNSQADGIAAYQDLADKIGATAEEVASLKLASDLSGVALETMASASIKLTSSLARTDDEAKGVGAALTAIGIELDAFKKLGAVDQIDAVAKALAGAGDGAAKTAVAVQLFGKSGADLIPMLNDLADSGQRVVSLTQEQIQAADEYTKETARLRSEIDTLVKVTAADAIPAMGSMVQMFKDLLHYSQQASDGLSFLRLGLDIVRVTMETLIVVGTDVAFVFRTLFATAEAYLGVAARLIQMDLAGAKAIGEAYQATSEDRRAALDRFHRQVLSPIRYGDDDQSAAEARRLGLTGSPKRVINFDPTGPSKSKKDKQSEAGSFLDYTQQITQRVGNLLEGSAVTQAKIYADTLKQLDDLYFAGALNTELYESALQKLTGSTASGADAASKFAEEQKRLADLLGATESAGIEAQRKDMELLTRALSEGTIKEAEYLEAVTARLGLVAEKTQEVKSFAEEMGLTFTSAFEDAVVAGGKVGDMLKGLEKDILRIIVRRQVTEPLGKLVSGGIDSLFGAIGGWFGGPRANGGPVSGGTTYLVGERGPELFTPKISGNITPNGALGGAVTVNVINQGGTPLAVTGQRRRSGPDGLSIDVIVQAVEAGLADNVSNRSGPLSRALEGGYGLRPSMG